MILQFLRELIPLIRGKPRRIVAFISTYVVLASYPESIIQQATIVAHYGEFRTAAIIGLLCWVVLEMNAAHQNAKPRLVHYDEFERFHRDQLIANEESTNMIAEIHQIFTNDDCGPTISDRLGVMERGFERVKARQRRMLNTMTEPYYETDKTGGLTIVNESFAALYDRSPGHLTENGTAPYIHRDDIERVFQVFTRACCSEAGYCTEFRVVNRGSTVRRVRVTGYPMFCKHGRTFLGHFGTAEVVRDDDSN